MSSFDSFCCSGRLDVSPTLTFNVTDAVLEEVRAWQGQPLDPLYPIVYLDALVIKMRDNRQVQNRAGLP